MQVDNETLKRSRPGATAETTDGKFAGVRGGLWRHPQSGEEAVTTDDPLYGNTMSQAFARLGFERVGDEPKGYRKEAVVPSLQDKNSGENEQLKGILSRLNALEAENAQLRAEKSANKLPDNSKEDNEKKGK
jgi:hypothetical protein